MNNVLIETREAEEVAVYTDGSAFRNGKSNAVAGVGVYFGPRDGRNVSEPLRNGQPTNQRAELIAVCRAIYIVPPTTHMRIYTDSEYTIRCLTDWARRWTCRQWKTGKPMEVSNKDIIDKILGRMRERETIGVRTHFWWVKGHSGDPGNEAADKLASKGSKKAMWMAKRGLMPFLNKDRPVSEAKKTKKRKSKKGKKNNTVGATTTSNETSAATLQTSSQGGAPVSG